jgi:hypothetical protein
MLLNILLLVLLCISIIGLSFSLNETLQYEKQKILHKSIEFDVYLFVKGLTFKLMYPQIHPLHWIGRFMFHISYRWHSKFHQILIKLL